MQSVRPVVVAGNSSAEITTDIFPKDNPFASFVHLDDAEVVLPVNLKPSQEVFEVSVPFFLHALLYTWKPGTRQKKRGFSVNPRFLGGGEGIIESALLV